MQENSNKKIMIKIKVVRLRVVANGLVLRIFNISYYMRGFVALLHYCIKKSVEGICRIIKIYYIFYI